MAECRYELKSKESIGKYTPQGLLAHLLAKGVIVDHLEVASNQWTFRGPNELEITVDQRGGLVHAVVRHGTLLSRIGDQVNDSMAEFYSGPPS